MRDKKIKLIYFSLGGSESKQYVLGWRKIFLYGSLSVLGVCLIAALILIGFTRTFHTIQLSRLLTANKQLKTQLDEYNEAFQRLDKKVKKLEKDEKDYLIFYEMDGVNDDIRAGGIGGPGTDVYLESISALSTDLRQETKSIHDLIYELSKRINVSERTREEIQKRFSANIDSLKHFPSIWPVGSRRITDKFGPRIHPLTGKPDDHPGIDISAPRGADVWSSADGKVVTANKRYTPNRSYGKFVDIDHGNGLITRYAHLSKIYVRVGQKVKRGDVIGAVGDTGMATGPHLHYEVISYDHPENPWYHMLD